MLPDGRVVGYGRGLVELARAMRVTRPAAGLLAQLPDVLLERFYASLSVRRSHLGRFVPDGPAPRRFP